MELRKEDTPEKTTQSSSKKRDIEGYTATEIRVPTGQTEGKILGEVIKEEDRLETPDTELRYNAILKGADVDWELHGIGHDLSCQGEENGNCHAYSSSTISARGSQCNSVSSIGLIPIPYWRQPEQKEETVKIVPPMDQLQYYAARSEEASRNAYVSCKRQEGLDRKILWRSLWRDK